MPQLGVDIDALLDSGELIRRRPGWYAIRDRNVLGKVRGFVAGVEQATFEEKAEVRVHIKAGVLTRCRIAAIKKGIQPKAPGTWQG